VYRPKSAVVLSRSPTATIGNQERFNMKKERILSAHGPGPQTYNVKTLLKKAPSATFSSNPRMIAHKKFMGGPGP
jgi:hypothetical protein